MMPGGRRGLVAPQNTFLDSLIKKAAAQAGDIGNRFMHITMMVAYNILVQNKQIIYTTCVVNSFSLADS